MKKIITLFAFISIFISLAGTAKAQTILYVNANAMGANNGNSWTDAYTKLSDAVQFTTNNPSIQYEIRVATGTYYPTGEQSGTNRDSTFLIRQGGGIKLMGGYDAATGIRDTGTNTTILSGNIGNLAISSDNSYHVMVIAGLAESADSVVVNGFTISGGHANGTVNIFNGQSIFHNQGGGIQLFNNANGGKTSIRYCIFEGNEALFAGGGIYNGSSSPTIINCVFSGNRANAGGGLFNSSSSTSTINCVFSGNKTFFAMDGVINNTSSSTSFVNCIIYGNSGGIVNSNSNPTVNYCNIEGGYPGNGNIDSDPLFVNAPHYNTAPFTGGDYRLQACSPSINTGSNDVYAGNINTDTDLDDNPRLFGTTIDMGAYEYQEIVNPPAISCPTITQSVQLGANCSSTLPDYTLLSNTDSLCGVQSITQFPAPGSPITGVGPMTVTLTVTSNNGLTSQCSFLVNKVDNTLPIIFCPPAQTIALNLDCIGQLQDYRAQIQASDNCGIQSVLQEPSALSIVSGGGFMTVTMTAVDVNGNQRQCDFIVEKVDFTPPTISCPSPQILNLGNNCTPLLPNYTGLAFTFDNCGVQSVTQFPPPGVMVTNEGNTTITLLARDVNGLTRACTFTVTTVDNSPPSIQCVNNSINFNGESSIPLNLIDLVIQASDNCGIQNFSLSPSIINSNQVGQTVPVVVTVTDINANTARCTSQVSVGGLPPGWSQNINGVGCTDGNDIDYNASSQVWTAISTNCYYSSPFTSDATAFAQRTLCGDGSITAQVTGISGTSLGWAGVVMRENNEAGAKKAQLTTNMAGNLSRREFRVTTNGAAMPQQFLSQNRFWLRVVRTGNQFIMYNSPDGTQWYLTGAQTIVMNSCIEIGLVATNYNPNSTVTATFAHVSFTGNGPVQSSPLPGYGYIAANEQYQPDFSVYPNPTSGELNLDLKEYIGKNVQIELYSPEGKLMQLIQFDEILQTTETLLMDRYSSGIYFVKLKSEGLADVTKRVVLQADR